MSKKIIENLAKKNIDRQAMIQAGFQPQKYDDVQRGKSSYRIEELIEISKKFQLSLDYLVYGKEKNFVPALKDDEQNSHYEDCYVAFLDILDFKGFVRNKSFEQINELCKFVYKMIRDVLDCKNDIFTSEILDAVRYTLISDTVFIAIPKSTKYSLEFLVYLSGVLTSNILLKFKLLIRGGISEGSFYLKDNISFGEAIVNSAILEKTKAIYPRIILEKSLVSLYLYNNSDDENAKNGFLMFTKKDPIVSDDYYIVDYLGIWAERFFDDVKNGRMQADFATYTFNEVSVIIKNKLDEPVIDYIRKKYRYIAEYYNWIVERLQHSKTQPFMMNKINIPSNYANINVNNIISEFSNTLKNDSNFMQTYGDKSTDTK